jgi:hypothetical protein
MTTYILSYNNNKMPVGRQGQRFTNKDRLIEKLTMMRKHPNQYTNIKVEERSVWTQDKQNLELWYAGFSAPEWRPDEAHNTDG